MRAPDAAREAEELLAAIGVQEPKVKDGAGTIEDDLTVVAALRDVAGGSIRPARVPPRRAGCAA